MDLLVAFDERFGSWSIVAKACAGALLFLGAKLVVHALGYEFLESVALLGVLMGGVVFTLAILLASVLADFKEGERNVGELASLLRRLHWDFAIVAKGPLLTQMRGDLLALTRALLRTLRDGRAVRLREVYAPLHRLDAALTECVAQGTPAPAMRTVQVHLSNVVRLVDRTETIVETTFVRAGYLFAGIVVALALAGMTFARMDDLRQGLFMHGFAAFLLVGLYLFISDLDHPFQGSVRITLRQLEKVEASLTGWAGEAPPGLP